MLRVFLVFFRIGTLYTILFQSQANRSFGHGIFRYLRMVSHRAMIFFVILLCLSGWALGQSKVPVGAPIALLETELYWKDWPERRTTENLLDLDVIRVLLSLFKEDVNNSITIQISHLVLLTL